MTREMVISDFAGNKFTTFTYRGKPAWIAREVAVVIGYEADGRRLPDKITGDWADEFIEGHDYDLLKGKELKAFKELTENTPRAVDSRTPSLLILYESGLYLVLTKTQYTMGTAFRRYLVDHVLPEFVGAKPALLPAPSDKEHRLMRKLELEERKMKAAGMLRLLKVLPGLCTEAVQSIEITAAEALTGEDLTRYRPTMEPDWLSPSQIAERMGLTDQEVGRIISKIGGMRGVEGMSKQVPNVAKHCPGKQVVQWLYSPKAVALIEGYMK